MGARSEIDRMLAAWGDRVFNGGGVHKVPPRRGLTGLVFAKGAKVQGGGSVGARAGATRRTLAGIAKKTPQVMVRISGGGRGMRHIRAHLTYISRNGQLAIEDHNGERYQGRDEIDMLGDEWQYGGFPIDDVSALRAAFNIVLSMPAGTDAGAVRRAAAEFARDEFGDHQYAMALHTHDTDPGREPSPHPHVHLVVKATTPDGLRLNPRKHDLQRWREGFAKSLREHGIEAEATKRIHRLQPQPGEKQAVKYMKKRGALMNMIGRTKAYAARISEARVAENRVMNEYRAVLTTLALADDGNDRSLAVELVKGLRSDARFSRDVEIDVVR
jgi:hypothetical protein